MKDFISFVIDVAKDSNGVKVLGKEFITELEKNPDSEKLDAWFKGKGYEGISLAECSYIITNKDDIIKSNKPAVKNGGY
jgi:hypothetical protein